MTRLFSTPTMSSNHGRLFGSLSAVLRLTVLLALATASAARAQVLDATFDVRTDIQVSHLAEQPDGSIIVGGAFTKIGAQAISYLAKMSATGVVDTSFKPTPNAPPMAVVVQGDGKILVGGYFSKMGATSCGPLVRLLNSGAVDASFTVDSEIKGVSCILLENDGKILVGCSLQSGIPASSQVVLRLNANGSIDTGFSETGANAKYVTNGPINALVRMKDGALLVGGQFATLGETSCGNLGRIRANGEIDATFTSAPTANNGRILSLFSQRDGKILVAGVFNLYRGNSIKCLVRLNADASIDSGFALPRPDKGVLAIVQQNDDRIVFGGGFTSVPGLTRKGLARMAQSGMIDNGYAFDVAGTLATVPGNTGTADPRPPAPGTPIQVLPEEYWGNSTINALLLTQSGHLLIAGNFTSVAGTPHEGLARLAPVEPYIVAQPAAVSANAGSAANLKVVATGADLAYQWRKDGAAIAGATRADFAIPSLLPSDAGSYDVVVSNGHGSATSTAARLSVSVNFSLSITRQPEAATVISGSPASFTVAAQSTLPIAYQWRKNGSVIAGATAATYAIPAASADDAGTYTCLVSAGGTATPSSEATLTVQARARLSNLSVRSSLEAGQTLLVGFVAAGPARDILVRAAGPAIARYGLGSSAMADPRLELYQGSTRLLENDNWSSSLTDDFNRLGAFAFDAGSRDAALKRSLSGMHSIVAGGSGPGITLVEAYDLGESDDTRFVNLSVLNRVGTGDDLLITGFTVKGAGTRRLLIRAAGPAIGAAPFSLQGTLANPKIELYGTSGVIGSNDNWDASLASVFQSASAFAYAQGSLDAALVVTLSEGAYTVHVKGSDGGSGSALLEIYELQ